MTTTPRPPRRRRRRARGQRGIAILAVITAVAICLVIVNEFGTRTTVDELQSNNNLQAMRSHFLARSAFSLSELILRLQHQLDENAKSGPMKAMLDGVQITDFADPLMAAFGGDNEQVKGAIGVGIEDTKGLGADIGTFGVRITPLDGKINVNCANGSEVEYSLVANAIQSLLFPPAFDPLFEEPDATGWRRDRNTQVAAIIDYIDHDNFKTDLKPDGKVEKTSAPEDYGYENLRDQYKPKNNPLDSIDELKLVRGIDDRFWTLFGNAFRVQGGCKVNLRAVDDPKVIAALIALTAADQNDPVLRDPAALWAIANLVIQAKQYGIYFTNVDDFATFVENPADAFAGLNAPGENGQPTGPTIPVPQLPPGFKGIKLDKSPTKGLARITTSDPVQVYQVEAWGEVTRDPFLPIRRTMRGVWVQSLTPQERRGVLAAATPNGGWQYLREE